MDGAAFLVFVEEVLCPPFQEGRLRRARATSNTHTSPKVEAAIYQRGALLLFLPRYSPDMNPIGGGLWSKLKAHLRRVAARTAERLGRRLGRGAGHHHPRRRPRLVHPLRLRALTQRTHKRKPL